MKDGASHLIVSLLVSVSAFEVKAADNPAPVAGDTRELALSLLKKNAVRQARCFVLDARTPSQEFTVWIDPEHGHNVVKVTRITCTGSGSFFLENVECKEVDGIWIPVEGYIRPSRQCLSDLAQKAAALAAKAMTIIVVQVSKADLKSHEAWLKESGVAVPIHVVLGDFKARQLTWGVKSLPWLILTDKSHIVRAEGFAVEEMDHKIQELEYASR
jgi:hypothetical protein